MENKKKKWIWTGGILLLMAAIAVVFGKRMPGKTTSSDAGAAEQGTETDPNAEETKGDSETESTKIIMTYQTLSTSRTDDLDEVVEAVNEIARNEIGVEIELKVSAATDSFTDYPLWISQGEPIDLMILNYLDITGYIKTHLIQPIDDLLASYGSGIQAIIDGGEDISQGAVIQGKTYGVTNVFENKCSGGGLWISEALLSSAGETYDEDKIYTMEEIDELLEKLKEKEPDAYPLGQITSGITSTTYMYYQNADLSIPGGFGTGIIKDKTVCNFYASDAYERFLRQLQMWYDKGYIFPDAAFTDESQRDLYQSGVILTKPFVSEPGMADDMGADDLVCLKTTNVWENARGEKSGFWVIPVTSQHPDAAMKFLNLMLTDTRIGNLLKWGIEGKHYRKNGEDEISYPEGKNSTNIGYVNPMALYGDYSKIYRMESKERREDLERYQASVSQVEEKYQSFTYERTKVADKLVLVQAVLEKYLPVLESGSVDIDTYYPNFLEELDQAGMQDVIADKQEQLDAYLQEKTDGEP